MAKVESINEIRDDEYFFLRSIQKSFINLERENNNKHTRNREHSDHNEQQFRRHSLWESDGNFNFHNQLDILV